MKKSVLGIIVAAVALVAILGVVLANKSNDSTTNNNADKTQEMNMNSTNTTPPATSTTPAAANAVTIENFAFSPEAITVKKGTTITWTNKDSTPHTVTQNSNSNGPDSKTLNKGDTYSFTFDEVGSFAYHCTFHSNMKGTVTVTE